MTAHGRASGSWRFIAFFAVLLTRFAIAEVQVEPTSTSSEETNALIQLVQRAIAAGPPRLAALNVRVTVGPTAFQNALATNDPRPIVATYLTTSEFDTALRGRENAQVTAVFSNPDPRDQVSLARALLGASALGVFDSAATHGLVQQLGESVHPIPANAEPRIDALLRAADPFDAIIALPDPDVLNRSNINHVVRTLYERRKVLIGYSATLTRVGSLASVYVRPEALADTIVGALEQYADRGRLPNPLFVSDVDVTVNERLARSLNIAVPDNAQLLEAIRARRSEAAP
jgi:hypothetical protein